METNYTLTEHVINWKKKVFHVTLCNQYSFGYVYVMSGCITVSKYSCVW